MTRWIATTNTPECLANPWQYNAVRDATHFLRSPSCVPRSYKDKRRILQMYNNGTFESGDDELRCVNSFNVAWCAAVHPTARLCFSKSLVGWFFSRANVTLWSCKDTCLCALRPTDRFCTVRFLPFSNVCAAGAWKNIECCSGGLCLREEACDLVRFCGKVQGCLLRESRIREKAQGRSNDVWCPSYL